MATNNYYGYGYNATPNQFSTVTGSSGYATASHAQHAVPVQSAYPPSQTTVQYGPYGTRNQATAVPVQQQSYDSGTQRYFSSGTSADSTYSQKLKSHSPTATYQSKPSFQQAHTPAPATHAKVSSSEWQPQVKQTYGANQGTGHSFSGGNANQNYSNTPSGGSVNYGQASQNFGAGNTASSSNTAEPTQSTGSHSALDAAVYSAATSYLMQKQKGGPGNWFKSFKGGRGPPDPSQWKYCELCKCTCAGLQAYKAHLVGKAHKKKEAMAQSSVAKAPTVTGKGAIGNQLYCQLCDVFCSSSDAYTAHLRGSKHQRILKLQIKMGKPIPTQESPEEVMATASAVSPRESKGVNPPSAKILKTTVSVGKKVYSTPKMTFVGGTQLQTTGVRMEEVPLLTGGQQEPESPVDSQTDNDLDDKNAQPVGLEYIEESLNETRTAPNFYCKLCDCSFTDPHAKVMHTKGRRHRLQYKKKVDPSLKVDTKLNTYQSRAEMERMRRKIAAGEFWRKKEMQDSYKMEAEDLRYEKELLQWQLEKTAMRFDSMSTSAASMAPVTPVPLCEKFRMVEMGSKRDSDHVTTKHAAIYPTEEDLKLVQNLVSTSERGLKLVSDHFAATKIERDLKGVMRVGQLAKGLLLHDSLDFELVVLCSNKPNLALLTEMMENLPEQLKTFTEEKFKLTRTEDGFTMVHECEDPDKKQIVCTISLTSPAVSPESGTVKIEPETTKDNFDAKPCLKSLAALRHAKWFQAKATGLFSCVIVIRIMMDFCKRVSTWNVVTQWSLELLVEKCISSETAKLSPATALRRVFEAVASGILLPGGSGVYDLCEKTPTDAFEYLTKQQREDLTSSAQHAVRMIAFGDIYKVLDMDPLPVPESISNKANKRKRASSS